MNLVIGDVTEGGGTDAAFAALKTKAPVIERFGYLIRSRSESGICK